jgi:hypothetical protein
MPEAELAALTMFTVSLAVATFLRSGVISNNDLGWRSALIGQFILMVWSIGPLRAWWRLRSRPSQQLGRWRKRMRILVALGLASSVYELAIVRFYLPLADAGVVPAWTWFGKHAEPGRLTFDARQVYERLGEVLPLNAVLQADPDDRSDVYHGLYGMRQTASYDSQCGSVFGGTDDCRRIQDQLIPLFRDTEAARDVNIDEVCETWGIDALIVKDDDPVFADHATWPWKRAPIVEHKGVRAVP